MTTSARRATRVASDSAALHATKNDIPSTARKKIVAILNHRLADCIDLQAQCKQAHWNVKGPNFAALHALFDQVHADIGTFVDEIAERVVQLGGVAEGTVKAVAGRTTLPDYALTLTTGEEHVAALSDALAAFGRMARIGIDEMEELGDKTSADIMTEVSRGIDKALWLVESHQQHDTGNGAR